MKHLLGIAAGLAVLGTLSGPACANDEAPAQDSSSQVYSALQGRLESMADGLSGAEIQLDGLSLSNYSQQLAVDGLAEQYETLAVSPWSGSLTFRALSINGAGSAQLSTGARLRLDYSEWLTPSLGLHVQIDADAGEVFGRHGLGDEGADARLRQAFLVAHVR